MWVALDAGTDRRAHAVRLSRAYEKALSGDAIPSDVRSVIARSWARSSSAGVNPLKCMASRKLSIEAADELWRESPLSVAEAVVGQLLRDIWLEGQQVVIVCDSSGSILWIDGDPALIDGAREINLDRGASWSESSAGTNAMGTALAVDHPIQVFSAEHFSTPVHGWTCSAAPIHDPATGELIGVIDLSGRLETAHPHSLGLVANAARQIESELLAARMQHRKPVVSRAKTTRGTSTLRLSVLGTDRAQIHRGIHGDIELTKRMSELLALLVLNPDGLSAEQIAIGLHGDFGKPVTARTEISRLRSAIGVDLGRRPYRLSCPVETDFFRVWQLLKSGRIAEAIDAYTGPILPFSESPTIVEAREALDYSLREAVLSAEDTNLIHTWVESSAGRDDLEACRRLVAALDPCDPRRPASLSRLRRLSGTS